MTADRYVTPDSPWTTRALPPWTEPAAPDAHCPTRTPRRSRAPRAGADRAAGRGDARCGPGVVQVGGDPVRHSRGIPGIPGHLVSVSDPGNSDAVVRLVPELGDEVPFVLLGPDQAAAARCRSP